MDAPMLDSCDARAIAPFVHTLTVEEHLQVIDVMESSGGVTAEHARQLRELILEARKVQNIDEWIVRKCSQKKA
jgi:hypothetical protein